MTLRMGLIIASFLLLTTPACDRPFKSRRNISGSWIVASETREVGDFSRVSLFDFGDLHIKVGVKTALRVEADDNMLPFITSNVVNGALELRNVAGVHPEPRRRIKYFLTVTNLDGIESWGQGNVFAPDLESKRFVVMTNCLAYYSFGTLTAAEVTINPGGQGFCYTTNPSNFEIGAIYAEKLKVQNNSNSDICVGKGRVKQQEIIVNNEGSYKAHNLVSDSAEVRMNGEGSAEIRVDKILNANLTNFSGSIHCQGDRAITQIRQSDDAGTLIKIRE
jgi:hypothetical protein